MLRLFFWLNLTRVADYTEHLRTCSLNPANEEQYVFQCLFCQATNGDETLYMEEDMIFHLKTAHGVSKNVVCQWDFTHNFTHMHSTGVPNLLYEVS